MSSTKKIVLVGHFNVGKSSMIRRFVQNAFSDDYLVTIGVHILKKTITVENQEITLVIWDIEGKEDIQKVRSSYLLGTSGFIYVIDPTRIHTYQNLNEELRFIDENYSKIPVFTVANKVDLINVDEFKQKTIEKSFTIDYFCSAKTGENVELVFEKLASQLLQK
jgi:small GTP-binding protein